jgi:hypothetical protein
MARWVDRRLSWRTACALRGLLSRPTRFAHNTAFGLVSAWLFSFPDYWPRLIAALMFLDGDLRRRRRACAAQDDRVAFLRAA